MFPTTSSTTSIGVSGAGSSAAACHALPRGVVRRRGGRPAGGCLRALPRHLLARGGGGRLVLAARVLRPALFPDRRGGGGNKERGVAPRRDADHQREGEVLQRR